MKSCDGKHRRYRVNVISNPIGYTSLNSEYESDNGSNQMISPTGRGGREIELIKLN